MRRNAIRMRLRKEPTVAGATTRQTAKRPKSRKQPAAERDRTTDRDEAVPRRLGMTAPALYWYFRSKEEILVAFLEHTIADLIEFVRRFLHSTQPRQRLWEFMYAYVLWQLQQQALSAAYERIYALGHLRNSLPARQRQKIKTLEREFYCICRDLVAEVQGKANRAGAPAGAFALIGMVEHLIAWFRPDGTMSVKDIASRYADYAVSIATTSHESAKTSRRAA